MSRHLYLSGVGFATVSLALAFTDLALSLRPGVTKCNVNRIKPGMTLKEAEAVLGGPGRCWGKETRKDWQDALYVWSGSGGTAFISFRACGQESPLVVECVVFSKATGLGPLERLRAWLGL